MVGDPESLGVEEESPWGALWTRARTAVDRVRETVDADAALQLSMAGLIEVAATRYAVDPGARWRPGDPLKLLFAGYSGTRNTGADVRVEEMLRQVRSLLGPRHCELYVTTIDPARSAGYFRGVTQLELPKIFPRFVFDTVHQVHGVIACEGSMFKSKFANALSTYMVGALGCAAAENKIAIGFGGEAGAMDPSLESLVRRYCSDALVMCRNAESQAVLGRLGVPTTPGTDTAWTFAGPPPEVAHDLLRGLGWDGRLPVVSVCPINPFWWPVKPDVAKGIAHRLAGAYGASHYSSVYFHNAGPEVDAAQAQYLDHIRRGVDAARRQRPCFVVVVGMEALDRGACDTLGVALGAPSVVSDTHDMHQLVGLLRGSRAVLSSRYHAIVCSMPARVPSAGITMDERIRNLMADRGTPELALEVDDPDLGDRVTETVLRLLDEGPSLSDGIGRCVVRNLERMGQMGQIFADAVRTRHPAFPLDAALGTHGDPWDHLPALSPEAEGLLDRYGRPTP